MSVWTLVKIESLSENIRLLKDVNVGFFSVTLYQNETLYPLDPRKELTDLGIKRRCPE